MFKSSIFAAVLFGFILSLNLDSSAARRPPPLLHKRAVLGLDVCLKFDALQGCRGGHPGCCRIFCESPRVSEEPDAAKQFCNAGVAGADSKPDPAPAPAAAPASASAPTIINPTPVIYAPQPWTYPPPVYAAPTVLAPTQPAPPRV